MEEASAERLLRFLSDAPAGVQSMSPDIPELVQTSLNLGIVKTTPQAVTAVFSIRSSVTAEKVGLVSRLRQWAETAGGIVMTEGNYPAWEYRPDSPLRRLCEEVFREQYGYAPKLEAIHAGLECGILCGKVPDLDCISLGPDLLEIHTYRERMKISSVQRVWAFLLEVLRRSR